MKKQVSNMNRLKDKVVIVTGQIITVDGGLNSHTPTVAQFRAMGSHTW